VLILDLMKAGLLSAGTEVVFHRPRLGATYFATVTDDGKLRLPDGRAFASPSRAASIAAGGSLDGWRAWQIAPDGDFLDALRQRLLDQVAGARVDHAVSDDDVRDAQSHHEFLRKARSLAREGTPMVLRVRDLLAQWGASGRTQAASEELAADLENHGLTTDPHFLKTGIDSEIAIVERSVEDEHDPGAEQRDGAATTVAAVDGDVGLTLGNLPSANLGVEAVTPQATYEEAITRMLLNDYSQLAVMTGPRSVPRAVTWQSIARERHANPDGGLAGAIVEASTRPFDAELIDVLPVLESEDFVFVKDSTNVVTGIVTTADVVHAYGELATPFFLIGELDQLLRRIVSDNFTMDEVCASCDEDGDRDLQSYDDLTMGDYQRILQDPAHWASLGWPLDRTTFAARLSVLREVRNDLVHFNPDPVPDQTVSQIRHMIQLLRRYASA
jgi:CBS domain-containing protein